MILDLFRKHNEAYNIQGYDDIKDIVTRLACFRIMHQLITVR